MSAFVARRVLLLFAALFLGGPSPCQAQFSPQTVARGKKATALVDTPTGTGTAFCVDPSGIFVTNAHVVEDADGTVSLALNAGETDQRVVKATVLRTDKDADLALLSVSGQTPFPILPLGSANGLMETTSVVAFGYPFGTDLVTGNADYPNVTVSTGHVTALRKNAGKIEEVQLDASLNPGNSGGPVLNEQGQVIGIVAAGIPGAGVNFAVPVDDLLKLLALPQIIFQPAPIPYAQRMAAREFSVKLVQIRPDPAPLVVSMALTANGADTRTVTLTPQGGGRYAVRLAPILSQGVSAQTIDYHLLVRRGTSVVAEQAGSIPIAGIPAPPNALPSATRPPEGQTPAPFSLPAIKPPVLASDPLSVPLPCPVDDLTVGGGGRYLVLWLRQAHQLAIFDVSAAKIIRSLPLASEDVRLAAGSDKLFVALNDQRLIQRWNLRTGERELTRPLPDDKAVQCLALGAGASGPLAIVSEGLNLDFFDPVTLAKLPLKFDQPWIGGHMWPRFEVRASEDGSVFAGWVPGSSVHGVFTIIPHAQTADVNYVRANPVYAVPTSDGSLILADTGAYTTILETLTPGPAPGLPVYGASSYFVTATPRQNGGRKSLAPAVHSTGDRRLLATLPDVESVSTPDFLSTIGQVNQRQMSPDERLLIIAPANLLITLPDPRDHLVLHHFSLLDMLNATGQDYLFVTSTPPRTARVGKRYEYQITAASKKGGVGFKLENGPSGMTLSTAGKLDWKAPLGEAGHEETVIVSLHDRSGQEIYHTFKIAVL